MAQAHQTASKLGQLIGEVIVHHTPWTSEIAAKTHQRIKDDWLEGLEEHGTEVIAPLIDTILGSADPASAVAGLLEHAARPTAQFGSTIQQFFIYGVMFSLASTALAPFTQIVANDLWAANPTKPLDPGILSTLAVRGIDPGSTSVTAVSDDVFAEAAKSGIDRQNMQAMADAAGVPPSPQDLFAMWRRQLIDISRLQQGLREGDTKDDWIDTFTKLAYQTLTPIDMVRAAVQQQLPYAEANALAIELGLEPAGFVNGNPDWFKIAYDSAGRPPGPQEVAHMALRGLTEWSGLGPEEVTFQQAIAESDVKTKWTDLLQQLAQYWPSPQETSELYVSGGISLDQAKAYWVGEGLSPELIAAFSHKATTQQIEQDKALAKGNIVTLLYDGIITTGTAVTLLDQIGYSGQTGQYVIELTLARREMRALDAAVRKVGSWYVGYKANATTTKQALVTLGIPDEQITDLLAIWEVERVQPVKLPTIGELAGSVRFGGLSFDDAVARAENLGYTAFDATVIIAAGAQMPPPNGFPTEPNVGEHV